MNITKAINNYKKQSINISNNTENLTTFNIMIETIKKYLIMGRFDKVNEIISHFQPGNMINNIKSFELTREQIEFVLNISNVLLFIQNKSSQDLTQVEVERLVRIIDKIIIPIKK